MTTYIDGLLAPTLAEQNYEATLFASAARTATADSPDQQNIEARGLHVIIDVTLDPALASITPHIQGKDLVSGEYYDLLVGVAIAATGMTVLKVYPGITVAANVSASDILPKTWRVRMVHADGDSITYSIGANLVL